MTSLKNCRLAANWLGCGALAVTLAGCGSSQPTPQTAVSQTPNTYAKSGDGTARNDADTTIRLSDDFRRECQLPNAPQEAPHFDFADATLHPRGANILDDVAKCLSTGPLKGRAVTIIGRTDPRGSAEYNKELSADRANAARSYLVDHGVTAANVRIVARGEQGARGDDEASWALDRRVDFELGDANVAGTAAANNLNASPSPILEGTRMDGMSPGTASKVKAGSYADTAEGGKPTGATTSGSSSAATSTAASGSVHAGAGK